MKKQLITVLTIMCLVCLAGGLFAQGGSEFTIPLTDPAKRGKLKAHLNSGSITVKGTARKDVLVKYKAAEDDEHEEENENHNDNHNDNRNKNSGSKDGLKRVSGGGMDLEGTENNNYVVVQSNSWNNSINIEIEVPVGFDLEAHTYNDGDLMITNLQGKVELTNYNGEITALNISGSVVATTYNGEIKVTFDKADDTPMSFHTYNGDVDLTFPAPTKASFKMKTEQGDIYTGFEMNVVSTGPKQVEDKKGKGTRVVVDDWKKGDINGGGPEITMKTNNGDIYVRKK